MFSACSSGSAFVALWKDTVVPDNHRLEEKDTQ